MRVGTHNDGFTLIEIIVVLMIVMIMTAAVVPMYQGSVAWARRDRATRDVLSRLKYAQERAITDVSEYRFYLNRDTGTFWLMREGERKDGKEVFEEVDDAGATRAQLPEAMIFEKPKATMDRKRDAHYVAFYPGGACDYATITIALDKRTSTTIRTKGRLGQLEVETE